MRYIVIGTSGVGKTTFARRLAALCQCPHVELDALHWGPHWTPKSPGQFRALAQLHTQGERWVADGNYSVVRDIVWPRATQVLWLNFGRGTVLLRILRRTVARALSRQPIWHGNRESLRQAFLSRQSILLWSATTFTGNRIKYAELRSADPYPHLRWTELRSSREADAYLARLAAAAPGQGPSGTPRA